LGSRQGLQRSRPGHSHVKGWGPGKGGLKREVLPVRTFVHGGAVASAALPPTPTHLTIHPEYPLQTIGISWSERSSYCQNIEDTTEQPPYNPNDEYISFDCVMSLNTIYWIYVALWAGYLVLAIYFDNILPNENGVSK
jgi:hypothetical protein